MNTIKKLIGLAVSACLLTGALPVLAVPAEEPAAVFGFDGGIRNEQGNAEITADFADYSGSEARRPKNDALTFGEDGDGAYMAWQSSAVSGGGFCLDLAGGQDFDGSVYTLTMKFALDQTGTEGTRYRKILGYGGYGEDDGLYFLSGNLTFYADSSSRGTSERSFAPGETVDLCIARDADGMFTVGVLDPTAGEYQTVYTWEDEKGRAVIRGSALGFFFDDNDGISGEAASGGRIYSLRLWSGAGLAVPEAPETSFGSPVSDWAKQEVEEAYSAGLVPEVLVGTDLTQKVDRAEFASIAVALYEDLSGENPAAGANPFTDIGNSPCREDIIKAAGLDITTGTSPDTFSPAENITREQVAAMLCRAYKRSEFEGWSIERDSEYPLNFMGITRFADDEEISDYARESVYFMAKWGIIQGVDETHFAPKGNMLLGEAYGYATREQAVVIALRTSKHLKDQ